jgi:hypothetical protein
MTPLELVMLTPLMQRTSGSSDVTIALIDGPVAKTHPDLAAAHIREIPGNNSAACTQLGSVACLHGTFVAGILCAKRGSAAPAICPNCTLLIRPIFSETAAVDPQLPSAKPEELARAILACVEAGARVINLSLALAQPTTNGEQALEEALDQTVKRGVLEGPHAADMTHYDTQAGGFVFAAGSMTFGGSLVEDRTLQTIVNNALRECLRVRNERLP